MPLVELGCRARGGSPEALDQLLRRVEGPVYRYLVARLRAAPDAEDLALDLRQEALIRAAAAVGRCTFVSDERLLAWVLTIARNVMLDHLRAVRGRGEVRDEGQLSRAAADFAAPEDEPAPPRLLETLAAEALAEVPEGTAELLRLRLMAGHTWKEVGETLRIAETAAKRRFQRAQNALRQRILARVRALPLDDRRAAALRALDPAPDGAAPRSPDDHPGPDVPSAGTAG